MAEDDSGRSSRAPIRNDNAEFPDDAVERHTRGPVFVAVT